MTVGMGRLGLAGIRSQITLIRTALAVGHQEKSHSDQNTVLPPTLQNAHVAAGATG